MKTTNTSKSRAVIGGLAVATIIAGSAATIASATTAQPASGNAAATTAAPQDAHGSADGRAVESTDVGALATMESCHGFVDRGMCFFWDRNLFGNNSSAASFRFNVWDHMAYRFPAPGRGAGERIGNNAGSFWNFEWPVTVYYNPSRNGARPSGPSQYYAWNQSRTCAQAGPLICNNNRSHFAS